MPMYAAKYGHTDVVKLLCNAGANTEIKDKTGSNPLHYAVQNGHNEVAQLLRFASYYDGNNGHITSYDEFVNIISLLNPTSSQSMLKATKGRESIQTTKDRAPGNLSTFGFKVPQPESNEDLPKATAGCESIKPTDNTGTGHLSITGFTLVMTDSKDSYSNSTSQMADDDVSRCFKFKYTRRSPIQTHILNILIFRDYGKAIHLIMAFIKDNLYTTISSFYF